MRPLLLIPIAAFMGLAACDDTQQTAQTEPEATTTAPADTATAPPPAATTTAPPQDTAAAPPPATTSPAPAQDMAAAPADTVDTTGAVGQGMMIQPGVYQSQNVSLNLEQDGTFMLTNPNTGDQAQGQYQQEGTFLTLMAEEQPEPMVCEVMQEGDGFTLMASDPSCEPLDGQSFQREG
jgi:hypothetical protein